MRKWLAAMTAWGWNVLGAAKYGVPLGLALATGAAAFGAQADIGRGLAWLQAQVQSRGTLAIESKVAERGQATCETAHTVLKLAGNSAQVAALVAAMQQAAIDPATESLACVQQLRQQLGQSILSSDVEPRRIGQQGYAPMDGFGVSTALDTGWALAAQLRALGAGDRASALAWLRSNQASDGSFSAAGNANVLATAVILRALNAQAATDTVAAAIASKAAAWLLGRQNGGIWLADVAATSVAFEAVQPYTGANPNIASSVNAYLLSQQLADGSWAGDPYVTAVALRALALTTATPIDPTIAGTTATVRGVVTAAGTGQALPGATVTVTQSGGSPKTALSGANGQFLIQGITPGPATLAASLAGFQTATGAASLVTGTTAVFSPTLYTNGSSIDAGGHASGTVVEFGSNTALAAVAVQAMPSSGTVVSGVTDASGHFDVAVPAGGAVLSFARDGYVSSTQQVIVANGSGVNLGLVPLQPTRQSSTLRGTVYDFNGQPIAGATVQIGALSVATNAAGAYSLAGITGTTFTEQVSLAGYTTQSLVISVPQPVDLVQDVALPALGTGYLTLSNLQISSTSLGLRQDVTATVVVSNASAQPITQGLALDVLSPDGQLIATLAATDSNGNPVPISAEASQPVTAYFKWNSGSFPAGAYQLVAKLYVPGTMTQQSPRGVVAGSLRGGITIQTSAHFTGSVTANPPIVQVGSSQPVALSALIQNDGNTPLPAQTYQLAVVDTSTGATTHTQTVSGDAMAVSQLQTLGFTNWAPPAGGNFSVRVTAASTPGSQVSTPLYVGAAGQASFAVDKPVVPAGTQTVRGTVNVAGQNSVNGTIQDPLAPLVKAALVKAVNYGDDFAYNHYLSTTPCFACHVQAQSIAGGERSLKYSQPANPLRRAVLASAISTNISNPSDTTYAATGPTNDAGFILYSESAPTLNKNPDTSLGLWGLSFWHDPSEVNYTRGRLARYLTQAQNSDGSWTPGDSGSWWSTKAPLATMSLNGLISVKGALQGQPSTFVGKKLTKVAISGSIPSSPYGVWRLSADSSGNLLVTVAHDSLWMVTPSGVPTRLSSPAQPNCALPLSDGRILIGNDNGIYMRQLDGTITPFVPGLPMWNLQPMQDGTFLAVTSWWDGTQAMYKISLTGEKTVIGSSSRVPGKNDATQLPDGSVAVLNNANRNIFRFGASGQILDFPLPVAPRTEGTLQTIMPYNGGVLLTTSGGLFFYNKNWVGQRWSHEGVFSSVLMPDGRLLVYSAGGIYQVQDNPVDTAALGSLIDSSIGKATSWLGAGAEVDQSSNVDLAFQLIGLADARKYFQGTSRASEFDNQMQAIGATLRSRQDTHGGWVWRQSIDTATHPMVTAMVGVALDTLNPSPNSPAVRNAVEFLLKAQQADGTWTKAQKPDGTWTPLDYATPLIPTTWVEIWLPLMLDRLGHMDSTLSVTFPSNVSMSNPTVTPTSTATGADAGTTYQWNFTTTIDAPAQVAFDLALANMRADEVRPVAQRANLLFKNSFTGETVTEAVTIPTVAVTTSLTETVATDRPIYTDTDQATFTATVSNGGTESRSAQVRFTVLDAAGIVVQTLPLQAVTVAGGETTSAMAIWSAGAMLAGTYQVRADLISPAGLTYTSAITSFGVTASQQQASGTRILTDRVSYTAAQLVQITDAVVNQTSNTLLQNVQATTTVTSAGGSAVFSQTEAIAQLAPGTQRQYSYGIAASGLPAGTYTASLQLLGSTGSVLSQSTTSFTVMGTDQSGVGPTGALQASPAAALIGQPVALNLGATNNGNTGLDSVPITVRIIDPVSGAVVASFAQTVTGWPQGTSQNFAWSWTAQGQDGQTVVAAASAKVAGREISLGQANVRLVGVPKLNAEPTQLTFPVIYVGEVLASQAAVVTSVGSTTATSVTLSLSGADASQFVIPDGGCTQLDSLPIGATCTFTVSYQPTQVAQHNAELKVSYADGTDIVIPLAGQAKPVILGGTVAPDAPQVTLGQSIGLSYTLSNPASASTTASVSLSVVDGGGQVESTWPIPASLAPMGTLSGTQSFAATGIPRTLTVILSQSVEGTTTVLAQSSFEVIGIPKLTALPLQLGFPSIYVGETAPLQTVTVTSAGSITATSITLSLAGASPSQLVIPPGECTQNTSLGIGATCTFAVSYRPSEAGTHSAQARVGYTNGTDVVILIEGQAKPVTLGGSVMPEPRQVAVGETTSLGYSLSNPANVSVTASVSLSLLDTSGSIVATWPIAASIAGSATSAGNQSYTPAINPQTLQVVLSQSVGGNSVVLATSTLIVTEIPVKVDPVAIIKSEARILVLVSCPLGSSANDGPPPDDDACVQQRSLGISAYLTSLGIAHKVVGTEQDFKREMCCGLYNTYWISGGAAKLRPEIVGQLRETIWAGESLITDGVHDSRNALLHPVNGILHGGKLPVANQPMAILDGSIYTPGSLPTLGQPFKPELLPGAKAQAWFMQIPGNQAPVPAVVSNRYGSGNSLLFAFDMAGMVTADPQAANAPLRDVMSVTASQSANGTQTLTVGDLTALALSVSNQGTRTTSVEVRASLPPGVLHHSASIEPASVPQPGTNGGTVTWTVSLGALQNRELIWRVLANEAGVHELPVAFYSVPRVPGETVRLLDTRSFTLRVESAAQLVQDALFGVLALQPGASSDKSNKAKALDAVQQATNLHNQGRYLDAVTQWLAASDALIAIASADPTAARDAVAKALEASTDALCRVAQ